PITMGSEPAVAPDRGGITVFRSSTSHQPPRQVNGVVRRRCNLGELASRNPLCSSTTAVHIRLEGVLMPKEDAILKDAENALKPLSAFDKGALDGVEALEDAINKKYPKKVLTTGIPVADKDLNEAWKQLEEAKAALKELQKLLSQLDSEEKELDKRLKELSETRKDAKKLEDTLEKKCGTANFLLIKTETRLKHVKDIYKKMAA